MPMRGRLFTALVLCAGPAAAQSTGSPVFHAPYRPFDRYEFGGNVSDYGNIAIEGFYGFAQKDRRWDLALRGGVLDNGGCCKSAILLGLDARYRMIDQTEDFPLDGALITGVGARIIGGGTRFFIPVGLSVGRRIEFSNSASSLVPYVEPVLIPNFGDGGSDLGVALGLGGDLRINRRFEIRFSYGIGDIDSFAIGMAFTR